MRTLLFVLLLTATASAQSIIYTIGPLPKVRVKLDTVTAKVAIAALKHVDSTYHAEVIDNGDFDCNGAVSLSDAMGLMYYCLLANRPGPKAHIAVEFMPIPVGKDSVTYKFILVDSVGVKLP